jgi:hypothetical protein
MGEDMEKFKKENPLMGASISELEEHSHKKMSVQEEERKSHVFIDATLSDHDLMDRTVIMPTAEEVNEFIEKHSDLIGHDQNSKIAMLLMFYWIKGR